jgi:hypothetical protein
MADLETVMREEVRAHLRKQAEAPTLEELSAMIERFFYERVPVAPQEGVLMVEFMKGFLLAVAGSAPARGVSRAVSAPASVPIPDGRMASDFAQPIDPHRVAPPEDDGAIHDDIDDLTAAPEAQRLN